MKQQSFYKPLLAWYGTHARKLPWRGSRDPYAVWLSEIMLQQTRVEAVKSYYARFMEALPSIEDLAACPEETLLKLWEGLGYYSRVRNMQKAAMIITANGGRMPESEEELLKLPGIGVYTAAAIASIAFGRPAAAVDGNIMRVYARYTADERDVLHDRFKQEVKLTLEHCAADDCDFGALNQALMDLGAMVCLPNRPPLCKECPLRASCLARKKDLTSALPKRLVKTKKRTEARTVLVLQRGADYALSKRPSRGLLAGLYELPSLEGHVAEKEAIRFVESHGETVLKIKKLPPARHVFTHLIWEMQAYHLMLADDACGGKTGTWVFRSADEIRSAYALPSAFDAYTKTLG